MKLRDLLDATLLSRNSSEFCKAKTLEHFFELGMGGPKPAMSSSMQDREHKCSSVLEI